MNFTVVDSLKDTLRSMRSLNQTELKRLREEFMIDNTYNSNAIEGNTLTLRETALIIQEGITIAEKPIKEHLDVIGHKDAFDYITALAEKNTVITEHIIKNIHSLVLMNDADNRGIYRRIPVSILGAAHTPPEPYLVPERMERLIADYNRARREKHVIEAVSEFHLQFEGIHPFIDGNGRTGRLILNLELIKAGYLPVNIKFSDRKKYYDCFDEYETSSKPDMLIELISDYETQELKRYIKILEHCSP